MKLLFIIPAALAVVIVALSFYLQPNSFIGCGDKPGTASSCQKADAIVVLSGGNTNARTDAAIKLFQNGWADRLIVSGAAQDKTGLSNAAAMQQRALGAGVPAKAIYLDETSATTAENAANTQTLFRELAIHKVILVTSGYHQRRASLEFTKRSSDVVILNHPVLNDGDWGWYWWLTPRGWWLAGGEIVKIVVSYGQSAAGQDGRIVRISWSQ